MAYRDGVRHAKKALSARGDTSDVSDAESLAQLSRTGWFKAVHMKAGATHIDRAALKIRVQLMTASALPRCSPSGAILALSSHAVAFQGGAVGIVDDTIAPAMVGSPIM